MPNTRTRFLQWPIVQLEGVDTVADADKVNFKAGASLNVQETPSRTAEITIPTGQQRIYTTGAGPSGRKQYCLDFTDNLATGATVSGGYGSFAIIAPFFPKKLGRIDELFTVSVAASNPNGARWAVFDTVDSQTMWPGALLYDSGQIVASAFAGSAGARFLCDPSEILFEPGVPRFIGFVSNLTAGTTNLNYMGPELKKFQPVIACDWATISSLSFYTHISVGNIGYHTNGFPSTFPAVDTAGVTLIHESTRVNFWQHWEVET